MELIVRKYEKAYALRIHWFYHVLYYPEVASLIVIWTSLLKTQV